MTPEEREYWRLKAAIQELCGATDEEVESDKMLQDALGSVTNVIRKWRFDHRERKKEALRVQLLKELGVGVIAPRKKGLYED